MNRFTFAIGISTLFLNICAFCGVSSCSQEKPVNQGKGYYYDSGDSDDSDDAGDVDRTDNDAQVIHSDIIWVLIPAGSFEMGCLPNDNKCYAAEKPSHTVFVKSFKLTETEITQSQYEEVMDEKPSYFSECPDCPVESINWYEASDFCQKIEGRLPTEAEWEYAARAGKAELLYYCGDNESCLNHIAWHRENSDGNTHPVGQKEPNAFGLYDMFGNVSEWTEDCWNNNYKGAPTDGSEWKNCDWEARIIRGGSWNSYSEALRISARRGRHPDERYKGLGFRCAQ